ncbi:vascular endothelial growth factor A-like isoform X2 [Myripristis murdjan]|uniref:vascular endothelial growth factor A-like isoform X2 n=1 Tax=Myripristis murdjan TaxID=586833 RepID=UPI0011762ADD|nr:vascular endothelial growth factor A-like isoform X2 [Myripristis murdjan]
MQSFIGSSHFVAVLLLQLIPAQISHPAAEARSRVMLFQEVWKRSLCRPMERLVDVEQEYPGGVEHIFSPACVPLWRCSGCCGDDSLECHPTLERNTTLQLLRITPTERSGHYLELTFVEHQECECRPRQMHLSNESSSSQSIKNRPRRRKHRKRVKDCGKCQRPHS